MKPRFVLAIAVAGLLTDASWVRAQAWSVPPRTNLKVLDKDITPRDLMNAMKGFTSGLGVRCQHCHVYQGDNPDDLKAFDFASDHKPTKLTARAMLKMVSAINTDLLKNIGEKAAPGESKVTCYTCHRGDPQPLARKPQ